MKEFVQIARGNEVIRREGNQFRLPLSRGYAETPISVHEEGLWQVIASPTSSHDDLGRNQQDVPFGLKFPTLSEDDISCLVSEEVGGRLDLGSIVAPLTVIE